MCGILKHPYIVNFVKNAKGFDKVLEKVQITAIQDGKCKAEMKVSEEHTNGVGSLHGGFSATLVDMISSFALSSHKDGGYVHVSVDMHMTYPKGAKVGDEIQIDADTLKIGKTLAYLEVSIKNKLTGELLVKGSHTKFLLQNKK